MSKAAAKESTNPFRSSYKRDTQKQPGPTTAASNMTLNRVKYGKQETLQGSPQEEGQSQAAAQSTSIFSAAPATQP